MNNITLQKDEEVNLRDLQDITMSQTWLSITGASSYLDVFRALPTIFCQPRNSPTTFNSDQMTSLRSSSRSMYQLDTDDCYQGSTMYSQSELDSTFDNLFHF